MKKARPPNSIGRKRRAAGWTLLVLGVVVAGVWVASGWGSFERDRMEQSGEILTVGIHNGRIGWSQGVIHNAAIPLEGRTVYTFERVIQPWRDIPVWEFRPDFPESWGSVPLWPIPLLLFATGVPILRSGILARRRAMTGSCAKCGYSLAGLAPDAPCPECGKTKTGLG